jgi:hypothetical protein
MRWISGFLRAFRRVCRDGDEADFWGFAGVPAGVPPVVLRRSLYVIYSTCLPPYNVVRPGASCHCDRCFCHSPYAVPAACISAFIRLKRLLHLPLRPYACARCMFAYASRMRCMQPVHTSSFRTMTFGAYRAFQAWARSTRAVRNHFFLLMLASRITFLTTGMVSQHMN